MHEDDVLIALTSVPDEACASRLAGTLVAEELAACVNRFPGVTSVYRWQGEVHEDSEHVLLIKTTRACLPVLQARLLELHPYELPELIAVEASAGSAAYLDWVRGACGKLA